MARLVGLVNIGSDAKSVTSRPSYTFKSANEVSAECSSGLFGVQAANKARQLMATSFLDEKNRIDVEFNSREIYDVFLYSHFDHNKKMWGV